MQQNRIFDDPANFEKECLDQGADTQKNQISGMNEFLEKSSVDDSANFEKESLEQCADLHAIVGHKMPRTIRRRKIIWHDIHDSRLNYRGFSNDSHAPKKL